MNAFRCTPDGRLDRRYLRVAACYRLLRRGRIGKARAMELLGLRGVTHARALVELWKAGPIRDMQP
jgi:hypothetical protein